MPRRRFSQFRSTAPVWQPAGELLGYVAFDLNGVPVGGPVLL
jgi:hypothetical protein